MRTSTTIGVGLIFAVAMTAIIAVTAGALTSYDIVGPTEPFQYPWRLVEPSAASRLSAWLLYAAHNLGAWLLIFWAKRERPAYKDGLHWFNWATLALHAVFCLLHVVQSQLWYDGLAQDVPEVTALGSVALMLMVILILEEPRRGLFFGRGVGFPQRFLKVVRGYHGYLFSWAIIYTFWYHPTEGTFGHLAGFFYMFLLLWQSALFFTRAHLNRRWTLVLEILVLPHGVLVAIHQGNNMWPMFGFGFGAVFILTQLYGTGLPTWSRRMISVGFVVAAVAVYALLDRLPLIHEVTRIPVLDYAVVFLLFGIYWIVDKLVRLGRGT